MSVDAYEILGVSENVDTRQLRSAYRARAREMHPDVNPDPAGQIRFAELSNAYQLLCDPDMRARIDEERAHRSVFEEHRPPPATAARRGPDAHLDVDADVDDHRGPLAVTLMLSRPCPRCDGVGSPSPESISACADCAAGGYVRHRQHTLDDAVLTWRRCPTCEAVGHVFETPCSGCVGTGTVDEMQDLLVKLDTRLEAGATLVVAGWGHAGARGGPRGDLFLHVTDQATSD